MPHISEPGVPARPRAVLAILALVLLFHLCANIWWLRNDDHPIRMDEAMHMHAAEDYQTILTKPITAPWFRRPGIRLSELWEYHFPYPTLPHFVSALMALPLGGSDDALAVATSLVFLLLLTGGYALARQWLTPWRACFAMAIMGFTPILFASSRYLSGDFWAAAVVVWGHYFIWRSDGFRHTRWTLAAGLSLAAGFLVRPNTFAFLLTPVLAWTAWRIWEASRGQRGAMLLRGAVMSAALLLLTGGAAYIWWWTSAPELREFWTPFIRERLPKVKDAFLLSGNWTSFVHIWTGYLFYTVNKGLFLPFTLLAIMGAVVGLRDPRMQKHTIYLLLWYSGGYVVMTILFPWRAPRYIIPMMPPLGLLAAQALLAPRKRAIRMACYAVGLAIGLFQFGNLTVAPYGAWKRLTLPICETNPNVSQFLDDGLVVYQETLVAGYANTFTHAWREPNYYDRAIAVMARHDAGQQPVLAHRAFYQTFNLEKVGLELIQRRYWPTSIAFGDRPPHLAERVPEPVNPYLSLARELGPVMAYQEDGSPLRASPVFMQDARGAYVTLRSESIIAFNLRHEVELDAISLTFPDAALTPSAYNIRYQDTASSEFRDFSPSLNQMEPGKPTLLQGQGRYRFHTFDRIKTKRLELRLDRGTLDTPDIMISNLDLYRGTPQPRPLHLVDQSFNLPDLLRSKEYLDVTDYIALKLDDGVHEESTVMDRIQAMTGGDFEEIDRFHAGGYGYALPGTIIVLARRHPAMLSPETLPRFNVQVSGDLYPNGRADIPVFRFPEYTTLAHNPEAKPYWACNTPTLMELNFGESCALRYVEVAPYTSKYGFGAVEVQYHDLEAGCWESLPPDHFRVDTPRIANSSEEHIAKTLPVFPETTVFTDAIRIFILPGNNVEEGGVSYLGGVFIYGSPVRQASDSAVSQAQARLESMFAVEAAPGYDPAATRKLRDEGVLPPGDEAWVTSPAEKDGIFAFRASTTGDGMATLLVNGQPILRFALFNPHESVWTGNGYTLAIRPEPRGIRTGLACRLRIPAGAAPPGERLTLSVAFSMKDMGAGWLPME